MSLPDIEKNDVDLNALFNYTTELELQLPNGERLTLYQRVIGDEDNGKAQVHALRESGKLRENLTNKRWPDRVAYVPKIDKYKKEEILDVILSMMLRDLTLQAVNEVEIKQRKEPDEDSTLEEREEYQKYVDEYPKLYEAEVTKIIEKKKAEHRKRLNGYKREELLNMYEGTLVNAHVQQEHDRAYLEISTYLGTFLDAEFKKPAFKSLDKFNSLPTRVKEKILGSYKSLEISSVQLKK